MSFSLSRLPSLLIGQTEGKPTKECQQTSCSEHEEHLATRLVKQKIRVLLYTLTEKICSSVPGHLNSLCSAQSDLAMQADVPVLFLDERKDEYSINTLQVLHVGLYILVSVLVFQ